MDGVERLKQQTERWFFAAKVCSFVACFVLLSMILGFLFLTATYKNSEYLGHFGDFVGGILNPVFSLFSFLALLVSLFYGYMHHELTMASNLVAMQAVNVQLHQVKFEHAKDQKDSRDNEKQSRRDLTISWHQNWMSPQMFELKRKVYEQMLFIISNRGSLTASAFLGGYRSSRDVENQVLYQELKDIMNVIQTTITFFENELVDKDLFLELFENDLRKWHSVLSRIDMRGPLGIESPESHTEEAERTKLVERLALAIRM